MKESNLNLDILKVSGINSKGYGIFPKMVAKDRRLTIEAKGVYSYFVSYAGSGNTAFPSVSTILYDLGIGETRYRSHFKLLIKYGYISTEQIRGEKGTFKHNVYTLNTEILESYEPYPQNRGTVKLVKNEHAPYPCNGDTDNRSTADRGTNSNSLGTNSLEEEEEQQTENIPKKYIAMALKVGASKADLEVALKKMDSVSDIKNHVAWLRKALESEVINRDLESRPKTLKDTKSTLTAKKTKTNPSKYDNFYL